MASCVDSKRIFFQKLSRVCLSIFLLIAFMAVLPSKVFASANVDKGNVMKKISGLQVPFVENRGQIKDPSVRFYANTFAGTVYVTDKGELIYNLPYTENRDETPPDPLPAMLKYYSSSALYYFP